MQNDLISRHYVMPVESINPSASGKVSAATAANPMEGCPFAPSSSASDLPPSENPPNYHPSYAEANYVEEPWPDGSDSDDEEQTYL